MRKIWHDAAWDDYVYWQSQDKRTLRKINSLLENIDRNGYNCAGHPEFLSGDLVGYWSVRIDEKIVLCSESQIVNIWKFYSADPTTGINNISFAWTNLAIRK